MDGEFQKRMQGFFDEATSIKSSKFDKVCMTTLTCSFDLEYIVCNKFLHLRDFVCKESV